MANIVLTGFMGTGKSTVGRLLSHEMGLKFVDLDCLIEEEAGMPVKEIFKRFGEGRFRELETGAIRRVTSGDFGGGLVISAGGGAVVSAENRRMLRSSSIVICLTATVEEIIRRAGGKDTRPLLSGGKSEVGELFESRQAFYRDCDLIIDTTLKDVEEVVGCIKDFLRSRPSV